MCRWLTYSGRPIYLEKLLFEPVNSLIQQSLHARKARVATNGDRLRARLVRRTRAARHLP